MTADDLPPIGLGTYGNTNPEECAESVHTALELGYRHVDTAEMYGNEAAVGEGIARADVDPADVFVATKVDSRNLAYDDAVESARASRDRLGVDVVDLLYVHWPIRTYDPAETLAAFDDLRDEGVIRHVGLSNFTPALLSEALERLDSPLFAHQVECHPMLPQSELRALARERGHYLVAYSPLAKGAVTSHPVLREVAADRDATAAQIALAWLASNDRVVPIPKAATEAHVRENVEALDLSLPPEAIERIDAIEERTRTVDFERAPWNR
nr:aldo/keto reductase [Salinilacihabitans rarus]